MGLAAKILVVSLLAAASTTPTGQTSRPDTTNSAIRPFDLATIESLGRQIYIRDQEAWKATDILFAVHNESELKAERVQGLIVDSKNGRDTVRFIREGLGGPEAAYDVVFSSESDADLSIPAVRTLTPVQSAQFVARQLALKSSKLDCSDTYNTVVLKDPDGSGNWLVWVLAATKDPDRIVIGGHYRYTISRDGTTVKQADALSKTCLHFSRSEGADAVATMFVHLASLTPVETHVFESPSYKMAFHIGTPDGRAWLVDGDQIRPIDMNPAPRKGYARKAARCDAAVRRVRSAESSPARACVSARSSPAPQALRAPSPRYRARFPRARDGRACTNPPPS